MVDAPALIPVTTPLGETVAADVFDDDHVARLVTSWVVPPDIVAVAVNWEAAPIAGTVPATATDVTVVAAVVESPHAAATTASTRTTPRAMADRIFISSPYRRWHVTQRASQEIRPPRCRRTVVGV